MTDISEKIIQKIIKEDLKELKNCKDPERQKFIRLKIGYTVEIIGKIEEKVEEIKSGKIE